MLLSTFNFFHLSLSVSSLTHYNTALSQDRIKWILPKEGGWGGQLTSSTVEIPETIDHIINSHSALFLGTLYCFLNSFKPEDHRIPLGRSGWFFAAAVFLPSRLSLLCFVVNLLVFYSYSVMMGFSQDSYFFSFSLHI